jgi:hypothetical protein
MLSRLLKGSRALWERWVTTFAQVGSAVAGATHSHGWTGWLPVHGDSCITMHKQGCVTVLTAAAAAAAAPRVHHVQQQAGQLPLLAPVLPVRDPLLPSQNYDLALQVSEAGGAE